MKTDNNENKLIILDEENKEFGEFVKRANNYVKAQHILTRLAYSVYLLGLIGLLIALLVDKEASIFTISMAVLLSLPALIILLLVSTIKKKKDIVERMMLKNIVEKSKRNDIK